MLLRFWLYIFTAGRLPDANPPWECCCWWFTPHQEIDPRCKASVREIESLNGGIGSLEQSKAQYGLTRLSDMSKIEFSELHLSDEKIHKPAKEFGRSWRDHGDHEHHGERSGRRKRAALPLQVDWRTQGVIGPVKDQGMCGACWAFSTVGTIEAMAAIKTGKLVPLSVQEVIDCAGLGNSGCAGGDICLLLDWLTLTNTPMEKEAEYPLSLTDGFCKAKKNVTGVEVQTFTCDSGCAGGDICLLLDWLTLTNTPMEKEAEYPLSLTDGFCKAKKNVTGVEVQTFTCDSGCAGGDICLLLDWLTLTNTPMEKEAEYPLSLTDGFCKAKKNVTGVEVQTFTCDSFVGAEEQILTALATHGPVTVAVNALTWQNYLGGVIQYHCSGAPIELNHAVELIGYDLSAEVPYYIAKNSWGKDFGNAGYVHLAIGMNICGLANEVATVTVK
ncbi:unnamed protein product [Chrysodeixis includens]|uniref:Peptidase C1A papain C-terminal domain-containing protein n=1 Tax=Chrysodeixis includens TaxID=689277 RepID=A0A9N8KUV1_CHRIL|nr:unnamed protein product [Chrysodeixis includens]